MDVSFETEEQDEVEIEHHPNYHAREGEEEEEEETFGGSMEQSFERSSEPQRSQSPPRTNKPRQKGRPVRHSVAASVVDESISYAESKEMGRGAFWSSKQGTIQESIKDELDETQSDAQLPDDSRKLGPAEGSNESDDEIVEDLMKSGDIRTLRQSLMQV